MRKNLCRCHLFIYAGLLFFGCASFLETQEPKPPQRRDPSYTWSSFFNNDCGSTMKFTINSAGEAILDYQCSSGKEIRQDARRYKRLSELELWVVSDLPLEPLYQLSNSKCRASLIYLGSGHATVEFPCALIHMTVTYDIVSREKKDDVMRVQLKPDKALIIYSDGIQEFNVEKERLTPLGPFRPFKKPRPLFTHGLKQTLPLTNSQF